VPSCSIRDDGLVTCFAGCARAEVLAALDALGFTDDSSITTVTRADDCEKRIRKAQEDWAWSEKLTRPIDVEFVEWYLRSRGITLPVPAVLRRAGQGAYIVCVQRLDGTITAVQIKRTIQVSPGLKQITRGWLGRGAVQLAPPCDSELGLAEGVESALSATQLHGIPCWATLGAPRLHLIDLPSCVRRVHLFADNDEAGRAAVERAKRRYTNQLLPVRIWWPPENQDWNDVLKGEQP
jgi:hypothetical protein